MAEKGLLKSLVSERPSDTNLVVSIHPLVLLTISDHITRHRVRGHTGYIVGALLGQQKGREISLDHAFNCNVQIDEQNQASLQMQWFEDRLQQYKVVHKAPALDLAGWFTLCPESGPTSAFLPIHRQFLAQNESSLLLAFHPSAVSSNAVSNINGRLPLTIFETIYETEHTKRDDSMQIDGEDTSGIRFRPVPYTIETDETEMIAVDYVARGGGNAAVTSGIDTGTAPPPKATGGADRKGKGRADEPPEAKQTRNNGGTSINPLNPDEEDQVASMTTRLNSVRMLQSRLSLLSTYLRSLPPTTLSDPESQSHIDQAHLPHLRNIKALITRLSLLTPQHDAASPTLPTTSNLPSTLPAKSQVDRLTHAQQAQSNDVALSSLLSLLGQDVQALGELGRKFAIIETASQGKSKKLGLATGMAGFSAGVDDSIMT